MKYSSGSLRDLLMISTYSRLKLFLACVYSVLNKICDIVPEILIGISIDVIVNQQNSMVSKLGIINPYHQLYLVGALTAILWILESVFEYLYSLAWRGLAQDIQHDLRLKTFATLQNADLEYYEKQTTGGLLSIVIDDINQLEQFLSQGPNEVIQLTVNVLVMGSIFFYLSPMLALVAVLPIPFVVGIAFYFKHKMAHLYGVLRQTAANLAAHVGYRLHGITTIKSSTTESYELEKLRHESNLYKEANYRVNKVSAQYVPTVRMAVMVGFILSLVVGGVYALQGIIPINWYASLVFLTQRFLWPFTALTSITEMFERSLASAKRVLGILNDKPLIISGDHQFQEVSCNGPIVFDHVTFDYSNGTRIFDALNIEIPAGKTSAFVGATGSGKSTLIKLLLRFYDPKSGSILIDGTAIKNMTLKELRSSIALVSQDVYLVDGTIADNICYGNENVSRDLIIEAAKAAQAHNFIMDLPSGYDTKVLEHGKNFSGGQRQRLAIARAIIKKSPILIFDEATSAVDNETEAALQQSIAQLAKNHTIIIIAHRLSTVKNADKIFVLDKGMLIESGTHEELLKMGKAYSNLWNA